MIDAVSPDSPILVVKWFPQLGDVGGGRIDFLDDWIIVASRTG
jgi:hypothetical protein